MAKGTTVKTFLTALTALSLSAMLVYGGIYYVVAQSSFTWADGVGCEKLDESGTRWVCVDSIIRNSPEYIPDRLKHFCDKVETETPDEHHNLPIPCRHIQRHTATR